MTEPSPGADSALSRLLAREILLSERRRVLGLAGLLTFILALLLLMVSVAPGLVRSTFHGRIPLRVAFTTFLPFIAYELLAAGVFSLLLRRGRNFWVLGRFANAFIETSFPTLLLYQLTHYVAGSSGSWRSMPPSSARCGRSASCSSTSAVSPRRRASVARPRSSAASTPSSRCWSTASIGTMAS